MTVAATAPPRSPPCPRSCAASGGAAFTSSPSPPTRAQHKERPAARSSQNRSSGGRSPRTARSAGFGISGSAALSSAQSNGFEELGCGVKVVVELVVRLISMGRGSKSIRRWRKDRKRKKAEREKRKLAAVDQRRGSSRPRSG